MKIQRVETEGVPAFRIFSDGGPSRLVAVTVHEIGGSQRVMWAIGPPGVRITEHPASEVHLVERRPATAEDIQQVKERGERMLGPSAVPTGEIIYGVIPPGFQKLMPSDAAALLLTPGEEYEIVVVAAGDFGSLEFTA